MLDSCHDISPAWISQSAIVSDNSFSAETSLQGWNVCWRGSVKKLKVFQQWAEAKRGRLREASRELALVVVWWRKTRQLWNCRRAAQFKWMIQWKSLIVQQYWAVWIIWIPNGSNLLQGVGWGFATQSKAIAQWKLEKVIWWKPVNVPIPAH